MLCVVLFPGNEVGDEGVRVLAEALSVNSTLRRIDLPRVPHLTVTSVFRRRLVIVVGSLRSSYPTDGDRCCAAVWCLRRQPLGEGWGGGAG